MQAVVTREVGRMEVAEVAPPGPPGPGEVTLRPEVVGICGSDISLVQGHLGDPKLAASIFPRIQGHEIGAIIEELGPDVPPELRCGDRVAVWPLMPCGECYPCRAGRGNACARLSLIGINVDGALQERMCVPASQVLPVGDLGPQAAALVEPVSIAVRTAVRGGFAPGQRIAVIGAGPIGQAVAALAQDRGATALLLDRIASRLEQAGAFGADAAVARKPGDLARAVREWAGPDGPDVVVDATGSPSAIRAAVELVAPTGRVVVTGISNEDVSLPIGLFTARELDVVGVSCATREEFGEALRIVSAAPGPFEALVTHEYPLDQTPHALAHAAEHPEAVMKAVIRLG